MINRVSCTCSTLSLDHFLLADHVKVLFIGTVLDTATSEGNVTPTIVQVFETIQSQLWGRLMGVLCYSSSQQNQTTERKANTPTEHTFYSGKANEQLVPSIGSAINSTVNPDRDVSKMRLISYVLAAGEVGRLVKSYLCSAVVHFKPCFTFLFSFFFYSLLFIISGMNLQR